VKFHSEDFFLSGRQGGPIFSLAKRSSQWMRFPAARPAFIPPLIMGISFVVFVSPRYEVCWISPTVGAPMLAETFV